MKQFDFGKNWAEFSANSATCERITQARTQFAELMKGIELQGRSFLDIGFGQGFSLLTARALGAEVVGCDIDPKCHEVIQRNRSLFPDAGNGRIPLRIGSILDNSTVDALRREQAAHVQGYDIVHSWGVLHHTGAMHRAIANAASLVRPGGHLVIAIYNRHWSSLAWRWIKGLYVHCPASLQRLLVFTLYPVVLGAKWMVTGKNPKRMERGMEFYYNVVDWVGGYPYEYASTDEIEQLCRPLGFSVVRVTPAIVPTGCNEFVFRKDVTAVRTDSIPRDPTQ